MAHGNIHTMARSNIRTMARSNTRTMQKIGALLSMAIGLTMLSACSDDDGDFFPSVITDLVLATSDSDGMLYQVTTDNGTIHNIAHHKLNISTPDTVIRCMISYTIQDDCATLYSISPVYCNKAYKPEDIIIIKDSVKIPGTEYLPRDPVKVISMWQSPSFINLHLGIMTTGNGTSQYLFCNDSTGHYSLVHRRPSKDEESYTKQVYLSMPVEPNTDSLTFSVYTYEGIISRTFRW